MELKLSNPGSAELHDAYGISEERSNELCDQMDVIMKKAREVKGVLIYLAQVHQQIAALCDNPEELCFCIMTNTRYLERTGAKFNSREQPNVFT